MRSYPHVGLSMANRTTSLRTRPDNGGRPGGRFLAGRLVALVTNRRNHPRTVANPAMTKIARAAFQPTIFACSAIVRRSVFGELQSLPCGQPQNDAQLQESQLELALQISFTSGRRTQQGQRHEAADALSNWQRYHPSSDAGRIFQ
jgi:hypothetical protein